MRPSIDVRMESSCVERPTFCAKLAEERPRRGLKKLHSNVDSILSLSQFCALTCSSKIQWCVCFHSFRDRRKMAQKVVAKARAQWWRLRPRNDESGSGRCCENRRHCVRHAAAVRGVPCRRRSFLLLPFWLVLKVF